MFLKILIFKVLYFLKLSLILSSLFIILVGLMMTRFSEKMLISTRCIHGFMSNLIKKIWTDSTLKLFLCSATYVCTCRYECTKTEKYRKCFHSNVDEVAKIWILVDFAVYTFHYCGTIELYRDFPIPKICIKYSKHGSNVPTNPIMITRIFPHWPMEQI